MEFLKLSPELFDDLYDFELKNRDYFHQRNIFRSDKFFERKTFNGAMERLVEEHEAAESYHFVARQEGRILARVSLMDLTGAPFYKARLFLMISEDAMEYVTYQENLIRAFLAYLEPLNLLNRVEVAVGLQRNMMTELVEDSGMRRVGLLEKYIYLDGEWKDRILYDSLLDCDADCPYL